jgi:Skp family chaperone for outer membrane proteins
MALWPFCLAALAAAAIAVPAAADSSWGVVDMGRVGAEYKAMREMDAQFQRFQAEQEEALQFRHKTRLLRDEERQEFLDLLQVAAPTEARDQRLGELEGLSDKRERLRFELQKKEDRTEEEDAQLNDLDELYDRRMEELSALQADIQQTRMEKLRELSKLVTDSVNSAVKAVAEGSKLTIVVRKETVLFGGTDITDAVLARLNATPPASEPETAEPETSESEASEPEASESEASESEASESEASEPE